MVSVGDLWYKSVRRPWTTVLLSIPFNYLPCSRTPAAFGLARLMSSMPEFEFVKVERKGTDGRVGLVTLNRPKALNALFNPLMNDLIEAFKNLDEDPTVGAMVLTGKLSQINAKIL